MTAVVAGEKSLEITDFDFSDMEEELRVDERCCALLFDFYQHLQAGGMAVEQASALAYCADYYLRDYLIDACRENVVRPSPGIVRYFAGNWFITHTLDPEMKVLEQYLQAINAFYAYLHSLHCISAEELSILEKEAGDLGYYAGRIESFLNITGDGYTTWAADCPKPC